MFESVVFVYQYLIFFYALTITVAYISLAILSYYNISRAKLKYTEKEEELLLQQPDRTPGISVVAPAYNEEVVIIDNVNSFLNLQYPTYEVVVVNDGSKDHTLDLLIQNFQLIEVPYPYVEKIRCRPVRRIFKSVSPKYSKLTIVDKENGGTKADAINAGINVAKYSYIINTDIDCTLDSSTLKKVILPVLDSKVKVIAVGATMRMSNGCEVQNGVITRVRPPRRFIPTFQETEYLRSYLVAKMGWSLLNAIPNVSGGFGLFDKTVVIDAGGFDPQSHAEDMDMTIRIAAYMRSQKEKYRILQIPETCCWTEGPSNLQVLQRQRTRWGRGLLQIFVTHRRLLFNPKYGRIGWIVLPYALFYEFFAPIIELTGLGFMIYLVLTGQINYDTFWLMLLFVFLTGITISLVTIGLDLWVKKLYKTSREYFKLVFFSSIESFVYHPFIVIFTLKGYWQYLTSKELKWGTMTRQGFAKTAPLEVPETDPDFEPDIELDDEDEDDE